MQKKIFTMMVAHQDTVRGIEQRGIGERDLLGRGSGKMRGNVIAGMPETKQRTRIGRRRLSIADKLLGCKGVSQFPILEVLGFKDIQCKK